MEEFCKKIREIPEPPILLRVMPLPRGGGTTHAHVREMLLPGFEGPNLNAWGVVKRKFRQGVKAMRTSAHTFLSKSKRVAGMAIGAIAMLAVAGPALAQEAPNKDEVFTVTTAINPGAKTFVSFDISWVDTGLKKYFLADRSNNQIDVIDPSTNTNTPIGQGLFAGVVLNADGTANNDKSGPDGVLTVHQDGPNGVTELWVGDSPGKVWVFNAVTGANILASSMPPFISVGGTTRADELCFDPVDHLIMIASPGEDPPFVTFISTTTHQVVTKLTFNGSNGTPDATGGGLEQCGWSPKTGKFYQNVPQIATNPVIGGVKAGGVAVIDPKDVSPAGANVEKTHPVDLDDCALPQGMAIGPNNQVMLGCNGPSPNGHRNTAMININSGATVGRFPDLGGDDEVWFNEGDGHYFFPSCNADCRDAGTGPEVLAVIDSTGHRLDSSAVLATKLGTQTGRRAHSVAADPDTNQVFVPLPANSGGMAGNDATMCDNAPHKVGSPSPSASTGCTLVFTTTHDDRSRVADERGEDDNQQ
jgi:hypothetical protein